MGSFWEMRSINLICPRDEYFLSAVKQFLWKLGAWVVDLVYRRSWSGLSKAAGCFSFHCGKLNRAAKLLSHRMEMMKTVVFLHIYIIVVK